MPWGSACGLRFHFYLPLVHRVLSLTQATMADMVALFSNVGTHVPFFKKEQMHKAIPESLVSRKILS